MGDASDIKPDAVISTEGSDATKRGWLARSWFGRIWRGEVPLAESFWLNGFLTNVVLYGVVWLVNWAGVDGPGWPGMFRVAVWVFIVAAEAWYAVGVWRSAGRYAGPRIWRYAARLWVGLHFLMLLSRILPPGLPKLPS